MSGHGVDGAISAVFLVAISMLWRRLALGDRKSDERTAATETRLMTKLDECEKKHEAANKEIVTLSEKVGHLEGEMEGHKQAREDLRRMGDEVADFFRKQTRD